MMSNIRVGGGGGPRQPQKWDIIVVVVVIYFKIACKTMVTAFYSYSLNEMSLSDALQAKTGIRNCSKMVVETVTNQSRAIIIILLTKKFQKTQLWAHFLEQDKVGRSKMAKKCGTSLMDIPQPWTQLHAAMNSNSLSFW